MGDTLNSFFNMASTKDKAMAEKQGTTKAGQKLTTGKKPFESDPYTKQRSLGNKTLLGN